jgi:hypothetical protein
LSPLRFQSTIKVLPRHPACIAIQPGKKRFSLKSQSWADKWKHRL